MKSSLEILDEREADLKKAHAIGCAERDKLAERHNALARQIQAIEDASREIQFLRGRFIEAAKEEDTRKVLDLPVKNDKAGGEGGGG